MASLRRQVEGWMGDLLYEKLGDEPHIETAWSLLRDLIGQQLFGTEYVPVPFIESAQYFNQLFVFVKKQNVLSTIGLRRPTYKIIGNMDYLVNRDVSTWTPQFDFSPWDVADGHSMYREYRLRINSNQRGVEKSVDFKAIEAHARSAHPPVPGSVTIHRNLLNELQDGKTLYVITDVVLATFVKLTVRIGNHHMVFIHDRDMPIGFKYRKYRLRRDGTFEAELHSTLKFFESEAIWLRPEPQPIPNVPLWDYMRRRYRNGSRRKLRHNLTIQPPGEVPDRYDRRYGRQDDSISRMDRPTVNGVVLRAWDLVETANTNREGVWRNQVFERVALNPARRGSVSMETLRGSD